MISKVFRPSDKFPVNLAICDMSFKWSIMQKLSGHAKTFLMVMSSWCHHSAWTTDVFVVNTRMHIVYFSQRYIICYFLPQKGCMTLNEYRGLLAACGCSAINPPNTHACNLWHVCKYIHWVSLISGKKGIQYSVGRWVFCGFLAKRESKFMGLHSSTCKKRFISATSFLTEFPLLLL